MKVAIFCLAVILFFGCGGNSRLQMQQSSPENHSVSTAVDFQCAIRSLVQEVSVNVSADGELLGEPPPVQLEIFATADGMPTPFDVLDIKTTPSVVPLSAIEPSRPVLQILVPGDHPVEISVVKRGDPGVSAVCFTKIEALPNQIDPPTVRAFSASTEVLPNRSSTSIVWGSTGAEDCEVFLNSLPTGIRGKSGTFNTPAFDNRSAKAETHRYAITCKGLAGLQSAFVDVTVNPSPAVAITFNGQAFQAWVDLGNGLLQWESQYTKECRLALGPSAPVPVNLKGEIPIHIATEGGFQISCTDGKEIVQSAVNVAVRPPIATIQSSHTKASRKDDVEISWESKNTKHCQLFRDQSELKEVRGVSGAYKVVDIFHSVPLSATPVQAQTKFRVRCEGTANRVVESLVSVELDCTKPCNCSFTVACLVGFENNCLWCGTAINAWSSQ